MRGNKTGMHAMQASRTETELISATNGSNILEDTGRGELMEMETRRAYKTTEECVVDVENPMAEAEGVQWAAHCIYRVPQRIRNPEAGLHAYKPLNVSIGPFHHGDPELLPKHRALQHVLRRAGKTARNFIAALEAVAERLESAYMDLGDDWRGPRNRHRFLQVMLTDGCFLLEIMRTHDGKNLKDYAVNDPVFGRHGQEYIVPCIRDDMLKIENQLPLLVLKRIVDVEAENSSVNHVHYVNNMVLKFMSLSPWLSTMSAELELGLHPLAICRQSALSETYQEISPWCVDMGNSSPESESATDVCINRCRGRWLSAFLPKGKSNRAMARLSAVKLHKGGIRFVNSESHVLQDIHFDPEKGSLVMPFLEVQDSTEHMLLNMVAFERLHVTATFGVTRYVLFMEEILKSAKDVKQLCKAGLVRNIVRPEKVVARMLNRLTKNVLDDEDGPLDHVHEQMRGYLDKGCHGKFNKWWGHFAHTYFHNPLMTISLLAATVLLALTIVQTVCAVLSLENDNKDKYS